MAGVTLKVSSRIRERIKTLADRSNRSMATIVEEALTCYERSLREIEYLEGWKRFQRDDPDGFAEYMNESRELEQGLSDSVRCAAGTGAA